MKRTFDDFDEYAANYLSIHDENIKISGADSDYFSKAKVLEIKKYEQHQPLKILDFGCGVGKSAEFFSRIFKESTYYGIDVSSMSIDEAQQKKIPNCNFQNYEGRRIPFDDESFDIVYIACVFHHIDFKFHADILQEVKRVLKKKGRIYMFEHNPLNPVTRKVVKDCPFDKDAVLLPLSYTRTVFKNAGLNKFNTKYFIFFPRHTFFKLFFWLEDYLGFLPIGAQYYIRAIK